MNESGFVQKREGAWRRLSELTDLLDNSPKRMSTEDMDEFLGLYREASSDLALIRTQSTNEGLTAFLNDLVARSYGVFYQARRVPLRDALVGSLAIAAQTVRRRFVFVATSAFLFFGAWIGMYALLTVRPDLRDVTGPGLKQMESRWQEGKFDVHDSGLNLAAWTFYASNNPRVAVLASAISVSTFGVGSAYLMIQNGAMTGHLSRAMDDVGKLPFLLVSLFPHGVPELSGAILSGASGFVFAWALICPGERKRGDALRVASKDALTLMLTAVCLMFIAAPIEAFFSFNPAVPIPAKAIVILIEVVAYGSFWTRYGRNAEPELRLTPA